MPFGGTRDPESPRAGEVNPAPSAGFAGRGLGRGVIASWDSENSLTCQAQPSLTPSPRKGGEGDLRAATSLKPFALVSASAAALDLLGIWHGSSDSHGAAQICRPPPSCGGPLGGPSPGTRRETSPHRPLGPRSSGRWINRTGRSTGLPCACTAGTRGPSCSTCAGRWPTSGTSRLANCGRPRTTSGGGSATRTPTSTTDSSTRTATSSPSSRDRSAPPTRPTGSGW